MLRHPILDLLYELRLAGMARLRGAVRHARRQRAVLPRPPLPASRTREDRTGAASLGAPQGHRQTPPRRRHRRPQLQGLPRPRPILHPAPSAPASGSGTAKPCSSAARQDPESRISPAPSATRPAASASRRATTASPVCSTSSPSPEETDRIPSSSSYSPGCGSSSPTTRGSLLSQARDGTTSWKSSTIATRAPNPQHTTRGAPAFPPHSRGRDARATTKDRCESVLG